MKADDKNSADGSDAVLARLKRLHPKRIDLSLGRMERLLVRLGHPENNLPPVVHIAGTNGKGSTTAYMKAALEAAGLGVQAYTSPHLVRFNERIVLDGNAIDETLLMDLLLECEAANGDAPITYFEVTTACAFLAYARRPADITLLEVGLGGRLDATNVIDAPALCVITPISVDHVQFLGPSLEQIAAEKAGILKPGVAAVVAPQEATAMAAIEARAAEVGAPLLRHGEEWDFSDDAGAEGLSVYFGDRKIDLPLPALPGAHQHANAALAAAALIQLDRAELDQAAIAAGLENVRWPARLQRLDADAFGAGLPADAEVWLDGGHNAASGEALARVLAEWRQGLGTMPLYLIVGMMNVKDIGGFLSPLAPFAEAAFAVSIPGEPNALPAAELAQQALEAGLAAVEPAESVGAALAAIAAAASGVSPRILIVGSLYLAGSVLAGLEGRLKEPAELSG